MVDFSYFVSSRGSLAAHVLRMAVPQLAICLDFLSFPSTYPPGQAQHFGDQHWVSSKVLYYYLPSLSFWWKGNVLTRFFAGPAIAGFAVQAKGWRWALWEIVWFTGPIFVLFFIAFPETSSDNILRRRAARLRKRLNRTDLKAQSEIDQADLTFSKIFWDAIIKPIEIFIKDPAITYVNLYTSLIYGIYYSFFEVFPLVYPPDYGFNLGETGLTFLTIGIACLIGVAIFNVYQVKYLIPDIMKRGLRAPEHRLVPALFAAITAPAGYFMFGKSQPNSRSTNSGKVLPTVLIYL